MEVDRAALLVTDAPHSRAQLEHNAAFARASSPPAERSSTGSPRKRALVTAFGRFVGHPTNASASIACKLLDRAPTFAPPASDGAPDDAALHFQTSSGVVELPRAGAIDLHVLVLPVMWDLAALLTLFAASRVRPHAILMNGVAGPECAIGIESYASNLASTRDDASGRLRPRAHAGAPASEGPVRILPDVDERRRALGLDVDRVHRAALQAFERVASTTESGRRFDAIAPTVEVMAGRDENVYLCNQITYLVERALAHPHRTLRLLRDEEDRGVDVAVDPELSRVPRGFVHWPSTLAGAHVDASADLLRAMLDAMLA